MPDHSSKTVNVYLTLDQQAISSYFNLHDPSPIYKRQLSHQFEDYLLSHTRHVKRYDIVFFKLRCVNDIDKQFAEPLMYAIHRHFGELERQRNVDFQRYKRRNIGLLAISTVVVTLFHIIIPLMLGQGQGINSALINSLDVFSWVILWHPIDELLFNWNPHLKELSLLEKLSKAEMLISENEKRAQARTSLFRVVA